MFCRGDVRVFSGRKHSYSVLRVYNGFIPETNSCNFTGSELANEISAPLFQATFTPLDSPFEEAQPTGLPSPTATPSPSQQPSETPDVTPTFLG